jgi:hypothetical protein
MTTVTYEITAVVDASLTGEYERYMTTRHIPDLLATGFFESATLARSGDRYRIRYRALDQSALDQYLDRDAPRLRADFHEHFPTGVELSREVWELIDEFKAP